MLNPSKIAPKKKDAEKAPSGTSRRETDSYISKEVDPCSSPQPLISLGSAHFTNFITNATNSLYFMLCNSRWFSKLQNYSKKNNMLEREDIQSDATYLHYLQQIPKVQIYRGMLLQGLGSSHGLLKALQDFEVRTDDIIIASYPKSGTTWTEEMVSNILYDLNDPFLNKSLHERVVHLEVGRPYFALSHLNSLSSPRILATHLPFSILPQSIQSGKCKIIYVCRNPKDVAVSYFYHHKIAIFLGKYDGSWKDFFHLFTNDKLVYGSWFNHVLEYWNESKRSTNILVIKYEDMKKDFNSVLKNVSNFIEKDVSQEKMYKIREKCTFSNMKNNTKVNRERLPVSLFDTSDTKFMRKGIVGDWKNHFSAHESEAFNEVFERRISRVSDLEFEFESSESA